MHRREAPAHLPSLPQLIEYLPPIGKILRALISPGRVALVRRHEAVSEAGALGSSVLLGGLGATGQGAGSSTMGSLL